jgi:hypothetical protein
MTMVPPTLLALPPLLQMPLAAFEEMPVSSAFLMAVLFIDLYCRERRAWRRMMAARTVLDVSRTAEVAAMSGRWLNSGHPSG